MLPARTARIRRQRLEPQAVTQAHR